MRRNVRIPDWAPALIDSRGQFYVGIYADGDTEKLDEEEVLDFITRFGSKYLLDKKAPSVSVIIKRANYVPYTEDCMRNKGEGYDYENVS